MIGRKTSSDGPLTCRGVPTGKSLLHGGVSRVAVLALLLCASSLLHAAEVLLVYCPSPARPLVLQKGIADALPGCQVTAFGRYQDFKSAVEAQDPSAFLCLPELAQQFPEYRIALLGARNGSVSQPYVLLAASDTVSLKNLAGRPVGVVDFLGREGTENLVGGVLGVTVEVRRVTKIEDLVPLMIFSMADAALVTQGWAQYLKQTSKSALVEIPIPGPQAGLPCICVRSGSDAPLILKNSARILVSRGTILQVDAWKTNK